MEKSIYQVAEEAGCAFIRPFVFDDLMTGNRIEIQVSPRYSILKVNDREYFFVRETGEFDGTGMPVGGKT
jgi:hypothetical protein